jgi:serine/alanine adding enzyme
MMKITFVRDLPEEEWRCFVEKHPRGNIFHTPEIFEVFRRTRGYRPELWAGVQNGRPLAIFIPVKITVMNGVFRRLTTRSVVFGSILCESSLEGRDALDNLLRAYIQATRRDALFTELRNLSDQHNFQPELRRHGFLHESHLNYLIHLDRPEKELFRGIGTRTRKNIRHCLNQGRVTLEEVRERKQISICYDLLRRTYKLAHVPLADVSLFENAFDLLYPKGMIKFTLAKLDQVPAAISVDLFYKDIVYGWYGGVNRTCGYYPVHELLMWHILKQCSGDGYRLYDFGGAGKPDEKYGVRDFKAKFGGDLVDYGRNTCVHAPRLLWLCEKGYHLVRGWL